MTNLCMVAGPQSDLMRIDNEEKQVRGAAAACDECRHESVRRWRRELERNSGGCQRILWQSALRGR